MNFKFTTKLITVYIFKDIYYINVHTVEYQYNEILGTSEINLL